METLLLNNRLLLKTGLRKEILKNKWGCPGIYIQSDYPFDKIKKGNIYIGKSKNIYNRLLNHNIQLKYVTFIGLYNGTTQSTIDILEDLFIKTFTNLNFKLLNSDQTSNSIDFLFTNHDIIDLVKIINDVANIFNLNELCNITKKDLYSKYPMIKPLSINNKCNLGVIDCFVISETFENSKRIDTYNLTAFLKDINLQKIVFLNDNDMRRIKNEAELNWIKELMLNVDLLEKNNILFVHLGKEEAIIDTYFPYLNYKDFKQSKLYETNFIYDTFSNEGIQIINDKFWVGDTYDYFER